MADRSKLMWSTIYWLCLVGCTKLSKGCTNCWALHESQKRAKAGGADYQGLVVSSSAGPQWTGKVTLLEHRLNDPLKWKTPQVAWLTSMSDLFHEKLDIDDIARIFGVMVKAPQHIYQVLTKRVDRANELLTSSEFKERVEYHAQTKTKWPLDNCWIGTSVEDQKTCDSRLPVLAETNAHTKFVSFQPLLEEVNPGRLVKKINPVWTIIGGEAGLRCRPYKMEWGLKLHNQFLNEGVKSHVVCYPYGI